MNFNNIILNTDSYKASHFAQYPPGTEIVNSYIESRSGKSNRTIFFGLQMYLLEYLTKPITQKDIDEAEVFFELHGLPFNKWGWEHILNKHGGLLPLEIWAVPEGLDVPSQNVLVQVRNTDTLVPWLTSYIETSLLRGVWYPTTVCTNSWMCKKIILEFMKKTSDGDIYKDIDFKLHDFGARGVSSLETASIGGCAHLVNFKGTDTISGVLAAKKYYNEDMAGFSIPAAEHSTICSWGKDHELDAYSNMISEFKSKGMLAIVIDSYDMYDALREKIGYHLKNTIKNSGAVIVVRPDSGNPVKIVSEVIEILMEKFGYTINSKGYKVLPSYIRVIQGDGVNRESIRDILIEMDNRKLSADNIAFGMGSALLQNLDRDFLKFAMKCSAIYVNKRWRAVYKDPITDPGKTSKKGILSLRYLKDKNEYITQFLGEKIIGEPVLRQVYKDGQLFHIEEFKTIRERAVQDLLMI